MALQHLPDRSRIWQFVADKKLQDSELNALRHSLEEFVSGWKAHGNELSAGYEIYYDQLVVIAVDEEAEAPSGCSIDKAFRLLQEFGASTQIDFFKRTALLLVENDISKWRTKNEVLEEIAAGTIRSNQMVADTMIANLGAFRNKNLVSLAESWLGRTEKLSP